MQLLRFLPIAFLLSGCASIPDITYKYYPARWSSNLTITQTLACSATGDEILAMQAYSIGTSYSSDSSKEPYTFQIKQLDRFFADADFTMTLTDDGRLRGINQSTTGQGESIVKSAVSLVTAIKAMPLKALLEGTGRPAPTQKDCKEVDKWGGKKPITLIYRANISEDKIGTSVPVEVSSESDALYQHLASFLPTFAVRVDGAEKIKDVKSLPSAAGTESDAVPLTLQKIGILGLTVVQTGPASNKAVYSSKVTIPLSGTYSLPIPKAALFGKQTMTIGISDTGAVTSLGYGKTSGASAALSALGSYASTQTAAAEAADAKAQADLIYQQQRVMLCIAKPDQCK